MTDFDSCSLLNIILNLRNINIVDENLFRQMSFWANNEQNKLPSAQLT